MSHILDELLAQAANGSPATVALSSESATVLLYASSFLDKRENWLDKDEFPLDEVSDADWDTIEKLVGNLYEALMNPLIGLVIPLMTATVPANMLLCDGSQYLRVDYPSLYAALDAAFIVDADNFVLPDLIGRTVVGAGLADSGTTYFMNLNGGSEQVALVNGNMPTHTHTVIDPGHTHGPASPETVFRGAHSGGTSGYATVNAGQVIGQFAATANNTTGITLGTAGFGLAHENRMPFSPLRWAVVAR